MAFLGTLVAVVVVLPWLQPLSGVAGMGGRGTSWVLIVVVEVVALFLLGSPPFSKVVSGCPAVLRAAVRDALQLELPRPGCFSGSLSQ